MSTDETIQVKRQFFQAANEFPNRKYTSLIIKLHKSYFSTLTYASNLLGISTGSISYYTNIRAHQSLLICR
jgi:hypothetical protein